MNIRRTSWLFGLIAGLAIYGAGPRISTAAPSDRASEPANMPIGAAQEPRGNLLWAVPMKSLSATRERPLFRPSRRPAPVLGPAPVEAAVPPPPEQLQLELVGTIVGGSENIAVFLDQKTNDVVRLKTGESHSGWILRAVKGRGVTLVKERETAVLALPGPYDSRGGASGMPELFAAPTPARTIQRPVSKPLGLQPRSPNVPLAPPPQPAGRVPGL